METQRCGSCKTDQPIEDYAPSGRGVVGRWCRACRRAAWHGTRVTAPHPAVKCCWCGNEYIPKAIKADSIYLCSQRCNDARRKDQGRDRRGYLQRTYGITQQDYDEMLAAQGGGCALCGKRAEEQIRFTRFLHIDHCHETGRIRGLLCDQHNLLLGRWDHDPVLLRRAADYLEAAASA